ncbi:MAG: M18 family aminopeptidase [Clostridia bacterium]|nr:M18 family aminopeptidase [Clostridia bacterium]
MKAREFIDFVRCAPTPFQAVEALAKCFSANGFEELNEKKPFQVKAGGKYFVTRNRSALIAFTVPEGNCGSFQITAAHSDSPTFKLKPVFEQTVGDKYVRFNIEGYGGMIMSTWFDRPLSVAGRVMVRTENGVKTELVDIDRDAVLIPNMPIHFNREVNSGYSYNPQVDLLPLYGDGSAKGGLMRELAEKCGCKEEDILSTDLFLYSRTPGSVWGAKDEFFSCGRIDDLECAWTAAEALMNAKTEGHINVCAVFDNEEVGSTSKQGADSTFLYDVLYRAACALGYDDEHIRAMMASGFMLSADNAHAVHPNHGEKFDADNRVYMNGGVVIKANANQKYTTDGVSAAVFSEICRRAGVPVQYFANRSDARGGSTLGNISNAHLSMNTADIGLAQLAMHSCYETAGTKDVEYMINAVRAFYETDIAMQKDGTYSF